MPRLPRITAAELLRALARDGWYRDRQKGSHLYLRHPLKRGLVDVPLHSGRTLKLKTLEAILNTAELSVEALIELL